MNASLFTVDIYGNPRPMGPLLFLKIQRTNLLDEVRKSGFTWKRKLQNTCKRRNSKLVIQFRLLSSIQSNNAQPLIVMLVWMLQCTGPCTKVFGIHQFSHISVVKQGDRCRSWGWCWRNFRKWGREDRFLKLVLNEKYFLHGILLLCLWLSATEDEETEEDTQTGEFSFVYLINETIQINIELIWIRQIYI